MSPRSSRDVAGEHNASDLAEKGLYAGQDNSLASTTTTVNISPIPSSRILGSDTTAGQEVPELPVEAEKLASNDSKQLTPVITTKTLSPPVKGPRRSTLIRLWFSTYRLFFILTTSLNLTGLLLAALGRFPYAQDQTGAFIMGNLLTAVLMRNEVFLRILYAVAIYGLRSWAPLRMKLAATSILQHVGGIHSGCALSGVTWLMYHVIDLARVGAEQQHKSVIISGIITMALMFISMLSAFPWVRNNYHNVFEKHHRFIGWLGLIATWIFVALENSYDAARGEWKVTTDTLIRSQALWFTMCITVCIIIPWATVRRVPVEVQIPSPKVAILCFEGGIQQGHLGRIGRTSLMEYHAFGIISEGTKSAHHYMVCGVQGDFTQSLVQDPPKALWTRQFKFAGVGHASAMFKRGIRVCTGTGIGAALSTCIQSENWFLIWIGSDQEKTFGPIIKDLIHRNIPASRMILWDTKQRGGRPDTLQLLKDTWQSFEAEVVFITSNKRGNDELMQGCYEAGIHAFGTLWDF